MFILPILAAEGQLKVISFPPTVRVRVRAWVKALVQLKIKILSSFTPLVLFQSHMEHKIVSTVLVYIIKVSEVLFLPLCVQ